MPKDNSTLWIIGIIALIAIAVIGPKTGLFAVVGSENFKVWNDDNGLLNTPDQPETMGPSEIVYLTYWDNNITSFGPVVHSPMGSFEEAYADDADFSNKHIVLETTADPICGFYNLPVKFLDMGTVVETDYIYVEIINCVEGSSDEIYEYQEGYIFVVDDCIKSSSFGEDPDLYYTYEQCISANQPETGLDVAIEERNKPITKTILIAGAVIAVIIIGIFLSKRK